MPEAQKIDRPKPVVVFGEEDAPAPVLAWGPTEQGWRAVTNEGEILNVKADKAPSAGDRVVFYDLPCIMPEPSPDRVEAYVRCMDTAIDLYRRNRLEDALHHVSEAVDLCDSSRARYILSLI